MIKLGTPVTEKGTGLAGMAIHYQVQTNGNRYHNFQPRGLNKETGQPLKRFWVPDDQLTGQTQISEPDLQLQVLGTEVEDAASGFKGMATAVTLHINGCLHVTVRPAGTQPKSGEVIGENDFDIRLLTGPAIKPMTVVERAASEEKNPSPSEMDSSSPREL